MRDARLGVVRHRPTELLEADLLAGDRLDHVGAGDEHVRGLLDHEDEVGDGRRVDGPAGARAHDQADLGDHPRALDVAHEHVAVGAERHHPLLDAGPAGVVDADHRAADLGRQIHDLAHLLAHHLAQGAAEDGEVLAEHAHGAPVDQTVAGRPRRPPRGGSSACRSRRCGGARTCRAPGRSPGRAAFRPARGRCTCRARAASPPPRGRSGARPPAAPAAGRASPRRFREPSGGAVCDARCGTSPAGRRRSGGRVGWLPSGSGCYPRKEVNPRPGLSRRPTPSRPRARRARTA